MVLMSKTRPFSVVQWLEDNNRYRIPEKMRAYSVPRTARYEHLITAEKLLRAKSLFCIDNGTHPLLNNSETILMLKEDPAPLAKKPRLTVKLKRSDIAEINRFSQNALHFVCSGKVFHISQAELTKNQYVVDIKNQLPSLIAELLKPFKRNDIEFCKLLMKKDRMGNTVLHCLINSLVDLEQFKPIFDRIGQLEFHQRKNLALATDKQGQTIFHIAARQNRNVLPNLQKIFQDTIFQEALLVKDKDEQTVLFAACASPCQKLEKLKLIIPREEAKDHKSLSLAENNIRNKAGQNVFHVICRTNILDKNSKDALQYLRGAVSPDQYGTLVQEKDSIGFTPFDHGKRCNPDLAIGLLNPLNGSPPLNSDLFNVLRYFIKNAHRFNKNDAEFDARRENFISYLRDINEGRKPTPVSINRFGKKTYCCGLWQGSDNYFQARRNLDTRKISKEDLDQFASLFSKPDDNTTARLAWGLSKTVFNAIDDIITASTKRQNSPAP